MRIYYCSVTRGRIKAGELHTTNIITRSRTILKRSASAVMDRSHSLRYLTTIIFCTRNRGGKSLKVFNQADDDVLLRGPMAHDATTRVPSATVLHRFKRTSITVIHLFIYYVTTLYTRIVVIRRSRFTVILLRARFCNPKIYVYTHRITAYAPDIDIMYIYSVFIHVYTRA